jgi:ribosomal protein S18 acetylase RimI-like enzyme
MVKIEKVLDIEEKSKNTNLILRTLPQWFEIEEGIVEYTEGVKNSDFYMAYQDNKPVGFISIKSNNIYTSEIYVMAILKEYQNIGIGKELIKAAQAELVKSSCKFLMVKTLGNSHPDKNYKRTREFYGRAGFYPLEEIKEVWGNENPCLIMVKVI